MNHRANRTLVIGICLLLPLGCSSSQGLHPESLSELLRYEEQRFIGEQPPKPLATSPSGRNLPKLGLYLKPAGFHKWEFDWMDGDRDRVLAWANGLHASGIVSSASFVPQSSVRGNSLAELRGSAARYGADLLLVIDGAASIDRYNNDKATLLYWTILGIYLVDGTHSDALCVLRGSLWDVKTGTQLFTDEAQATAKQIGPAAMVQDRATVSEACRQALTQLLTILKNRLGHPQNS